MSDLSVGSTIAGCRLEAVAGRGGMGVVYRATQLALERSVALKAIAPQLAQDAAYRERFQRESQIAASIDHPNVIPVYEAGELDQTLYLIMRWVDGTDLRALLASCGRLSPARAVRLLRPVASALAAAHRRGLVHRDVKPANVLIAHADGDDDEHVYLTDFGIARRIDGQAGMTRTGVLVGTIDYTAPERIEGGKGDAASDIYAFGCMLFEALTGHVPFDRTNDVTKMYAHLNDAVPLARNAAPAVPERLDAIITTAMAKRPEDRFASATELATALGRALEDDETDEVVLGARLNRSEPPTDETEPYVAATEAAQPAAELPEVPEAAAEAAAVPAAAAEAAAVPAAAAPATAPSAAVDDRPPAPAAPERRKPSRPRPLLLAPIVLVAVVGVLVAVLSGGGTGPHAAPAQVLLGGSSVSIGSPVGLGAGSAPGALAAAGSQVWVAAHGKLALVGGQGVARRIAISGDPTSLAVDGSGRVWMTGVGSTGVTVLGTDNVQTPVHAGRDPAAIAISPDAAWIASSGESSVTRVDLSSLNSTATIPVGGRPAAIGEAYGRTWVAPKIGSVTVLDDSGVQDSIAGPSLPASTVGIAQSNGVWFLGASAGSSSALTRVDPNKTRAVNGQYLVHPNQAPGIRAPSGIGASSQQNSLWVLARDDRTLTRIATTGATNNEPTAEVRFPAPPSRLAVGDHVVWVDIPSTGQVYPITF